MDEKIQNHQQKSFFSWMRKTNNIIIDDEYQKTNDLGT
jgi:hypothetical protein